MDKSILKRQIKTVIYYAKHFGMIATEVCNKESYSHVLLGKQIQIQLRGSNDGSTLDYLLRFFLIQQAVSLTSYPTTMSTPLPIVHKGLVGACSHPTTLS